MTHGTTTAYQDGCRCTPCTEANRARCAQFRASGAPVHQHGVSAYRNQGCRCAMCTAANTAACRAWRDRQREAASPQT